MVHNMSTFESRKDISVIKNFLLHTAVAILETCRELKIKVMNFGHPGHWKIDPDLASQWPPRWNDPCAWMKHLMSFMCPK